MPGKRGTSTSTGLALTSGAAHVKRWPRAARLAPDVSRHARGTWLADPRYPAVLKQFRVRAYPLRFASAEILAAMRRFREGLRRRRVKYPYAVGRRLRNLAVLVTNHWLNLRRIDDEFRAKMETHYARDAAFINSQCRALK